MQFPSTYHQCIRKRPQLHIPYIAIFAQVTLIHSVRFKESRLAACPTTRSCRRRRRRSMGPPTTTDRSMHAGHGGGEEAGRAGGRTAGRTDREGRKEGRRRRPDRPTTACMRPVSELTWMGREKARAEGGRGGGGRRGWGRANYVSAVQLYLHGHDSIALRDDAAT